MAEASGDDAPQGATVRVEPSKIELVVRRGETVFGAAWRLQLDWPTVCFGQAQCTFCHVRILEGAENVVPMRTDGDEPVMVRRVAGRLYGGDETNLRLACQLQVTGPVVLEQTNFTGPKDGESAD